jgi:hypothetical protein
MNRIAVEMEMLRHKRFALAALLVIGIVFETVWDGGGGCSVVGR